jgi:cysteinyl-tRNA synthetase
MRGTEIMRRHLFCMMSCVFTVFILGCVENGEEEDTVRDYRQDMRDFVQAISNYAKDINSDFIILPQNGEELLTSNGEPTGSLMVAYVGAIDGLGREDLFYGYNGDNIATPVLIRDGMIAFLDIAETNGIEVLATDYCSTQTYVDSSYTQNAVRGYISFAANHRDLDNIPPYPVEPYNVHDSTVSSLREAHNFLYLIDPGLYGDKETFLYYMAQTNYDILIIDLFFETIELNAADVMSLKIKANAGLRLVLAYTSIGEAEDYRYYWQTEWENNPPLWLGDENPDWPGNYAVHYWEKDWQNIIFGNTSSYMKKILDAEFDGVYLDKIDAYEYFEDH